MDGNNWRPAAQGEPNPNMDSNDWRTQISPYSRQRVVSKIMDTLKKHLPISGPEGLTELKRIAVRFEEKIYTAATSQTDYLRKICVKMLTMESKSQSTFTGGNSMPTNSTDANQTPPDPDTLLRLSSSSSQDFQLRLADEGQTVFYECPKCKYKFSQNT